MKKKLSGFTLVELMVAITIIAILSSISIFGLTSIRQKAQDTSRLAGIRDLQVSLEAFKSVNGKYPEQGATIENYIALNQVPPFAPTYINKLPQDNPQTSTNGFKYTTSSDRKTYCVGVKGNVHKNSSQPDLAVGVGPKDWKACYGPQASTLAF